MATPRKVFTTAWIMGMTAATAMAQNDTVWDQHGTLRVSDNDRYLEHTDGTPFFWLGGTAWGMGSRTTREDVDLYLNDRQAKGFTVVQAVAHWRHSAGPQDGWGPRANNPVNRYGHVPFAGGEADPDTTTPLINPGGTPDAPNDYWDHIDYIVRETRARGMALALLPTWGLQSISSSNPDQVVFDQAEAQAYGEFIGQRYGDQPHIIWTLGGDTSSAPKNKYNAMAQGIQTGVAAAGGVNPLLTFHPSSGQASSSGFNSESWLDINMFQSGQRGLNRVGEMTTSYYNRTPTRPVINAEAGYEGVTQWAGNLRKTPVIVRRAAYQSYFRGAAGFTYGHEPSSSSGVDAIWAFGTDGDGWQALLDAPGAEDMTHLKELITDREWWKWVPDRTILENETTRLLVNQKTDGNEWYQIGSFAFDGDAVVEISTEGTDGFVVADAIRFQSITSGTTVTVDNLDAGVTVNGDWSASSATGGYHGSNYLHDGNTDKGGKSVVFSEALTGDYRVFVRWTSDNNRASNVPIGVNGELLGSSMLEHSALRSTDGDELLVYFAGIHEAVISLESITTEDYAVARWFNPADGTWQAIDGTFATTGAFAFAPPDGWEDAVLVLQAVPEPGSMALLALGGAAMLSRRRR